jgi:hypothetical protein
MSALLRTTLAALGGLLLLTACSGSGGASAPSSVPGATRATSAAPPASTAAQSKSARATSAAPAYASPAAGMSLSGAWNGQYSGRYSGTFHLTWTQAGASLAGTIVLSEPSYPLHLTGHLAGARIAFGTVGSTEISYTGVVTGGQMIGSYAVGGRTAGTWRASHA